MPDLALSATLFASDAIDSAFSAVWFALPICAAKPEAVLFAASATCLTESKSSEATSALIVPPEIDRPRPAVKDTPPPVEPEDEEEEELV